MLRGEHLDFAQRTFRLGLAAATVLICGQVFLGDILFGVIAEHQPAKEQAVEGFWEPRASAPYNWIVVSDQAGQRNRLEIGMPLLGSILVTHTLHGTVSGLTQTPPNRQPNAALGAAEIGGIAALWQEHALMSAAAVGAFFALLAGAASLACRRADALPLLASVAVVAFGVLGVAPAIWPHAVPHAASIWEAASPPGSRLFLLVGVIALMPVVLGYTAFAYWIFRGKVTPLEAVS